MIWFNLKKLERLLIQNKITEAISYQYLLVLLVLLTLSSNVPVKYFSHTGWEISYIILDLLITIVGTYLLFKVNSNGDNRDFLKRYFSLAFVNALRLIIFYLVLRLIFKIIMFVIPLDLWYTINDFLGEDAGEFFFDIIFSLIFYWLLMSSFKRVNSGRSEEKVAVQSDVKKA
ncbi:hypothetical protein APR41_02905 [Salegentibacter salinarum]|uniref:Uncharacterized protein n=1 Tax=Salegentibacter salinarum TaxID=447422 RepID=A0A2N0TXW8_9FLAO|nr:hypothetical protein [Salegentibacter salinarum]PKD19571.1 hypothetical protein APR41_02905 [Salegentibacter salinarum]SKB42002.1 hypothetical protein SAMN05660903_00594 [Salegentibacter salinarum]